MNDIIFQIQSMIADNDLDHAQSLIQELLKEHPSDPMLLFLMGKIFWKKGNRKEAISFYLKAQEIDPVGPASKALEMAHDIDSYFNPDLLNP